MKRTKKVLIIVFLILLVLVAAAAGVCYWQRDNLAAVQMSASLSQEELSERITTNNEKISEVSEKVGGVTVRDMTDEERQALREGKLSREEVLERMIQEEPAKADTASTASETDAAEAGSNQPDTETGSTIPSESGGEREEDSNQKILSRYLAEIYLLKDDYTVWLEAKYAEAIDAYNALEESERTASAKYSIGLRCMREALAKEKECDAQMADMEQKISDLLTEMGEDTSMVEEIQSIYEEEKALKKAYYLGLHD